jgi:hypothetical protein
VNNAVYYTVNNDSKYLKYLKTSIVSLRNFNKQIKIYVFVFSDNRNLLEDFFAENNIEVIYREAVKPYQLTSMKWYALRYLANIKEKSLIYLDVDTICFKDIALLFEKYQGSDLYAREELGTEEKCPYVKGELTISSQLDQKIHHSLIRKLRVKKVPVLNTGIMIFNNSSFTKIIPHLDYYQNLLDSFFKREIPFPAQYHILEEISWTYTLGKINNLSYDFIREEDSPFYIELRVKAISDPGIVLHVWSKLYQFFLEDYPLSELGFSGV